MIPLHKELKKKKKELIKPHKSQMRSVNHKISGATNTFVLRRGNLDSMIYFTINRINEYKKILLFIMIQEAFGVQTFS